MRPFSGQSSDNRLRPVLLARLNCGHAEPEVVPPVARRVPVAARRPAVPAVVFPAPAAEHPVVRGLFGYLRIGSSRERLIIPITAPFPHVAVHVVQAPSIGLITSDRR